MNSVAAKRWLGLLLPSLALMGIAGCFLSPAAIKYQAILTPLEGQKSMREEAQYVPSEDGTISYEVPGMRIEVKPMLPGDRFGPSPSATSTRFWAGASFG